jgi:hypothetical protein
MYVHGWAVPEDFSPLAFSTDPSATVTVGWSGLTADERYFGAVAHTDGAEVLAQTIVEVDG